MNPDRLALWETPEEPADDAPLSGPAMEGFARDVLAVVARRMRARRQIARLQGNVTRIGAPPPCDPDDGEALSSPMLARKARSDRDWIRIQ